MVGRVKVITRNLQITYVVDKLSPLMKREVFGGLLEEREDITL